MHWVFSMKMFPPKFSIIQSAIDRWFDCIGQDRDSCHLGTLPTILQHFTHTTKPVTHYSSLVSLCAAGCPYIYCVYFPCDKASVLLLVLADHLKQIKTIFFNVNVDSVTSFVPCSKGPSCAIRVNMVVEISELYNELSKGC